MRLVQIRHLIDAGPFTATPAWQRIEAEVHRAISAIVWPPDSDKFVINAAEKHGNGVIPIKRQFADNIASLGWQLELKFPVFSEEEASKRQPGKVDAALALEGYGLPPFFVEWETGNISSSHRAMNKMALALKRGMIAGGLWVVPSRGLAWHLTDRIGNYPEFEPYFSLYTDLNVEFGYLGAAIVEHDGANLEVPQIPKQRTGNRRAPEEDGASEQLPL